jgi:hypothetical protein
MQIYLEYDIHVIEQFRAVMETNHSLPSAAVSAISTAQ